MTRQSRKPLINTLMIAFTAVIVAVTAWILLVHGHTAAY